MRLIIVPTDFSPLADNALKSGRFFMESSSIGVINRVTVPVYGFIEDKDVEEGINDFAEKNNLDAVITLPKKHGLLQSLFQKSTTRELVRHTNVPLICIRKEVMETVKTLQT